MAKVTGRADITVNGTLIDTFDGVKLETGGVKRDPVETSKRVHFSSKRVASKLEIERAFTAGSSINDLDVEDAVIQVKFDTGQTYIMRHGFRVDPEALGDEGKSAVVFQGEPCEEIL